MIPAFGYLRVSGLTQASDDAGGLPRQKTAIELFAAKNDYEIIRWFADEGVSGKTDLENRPALRQLLSELGQVKVVIIEKVDRLARDLMISETIIANLRKREITLLSVAEPDLCSTDPTRKLVRQIMGAIAEFDRDMICARLKAGADLKRDTCVNCGDIKNDCICPSFVGHKWGGRKPYGTRPEEASIVQKIRELDIRGLSLTAIATKLNENGFTSRSGKLWHPMQVARVLNQKCSN